MKYTDISLIINKLFRCTRWLLVLRTEVPPARPPGPHSSSRQRTGQNTCIYVFETLRRINKRCQIFIMWHFHFWNFILLYFFHQQLFNSTYYKQLLVHLIFKMFAIFIWQSWSRSRLPAFTGGQTDLEVTVTENQVEEVNLPQLEANGLNFQVDLLFTNNKKPCIGAKDKGFVRGKHIERFMMKKFLFIKEEKNWQNILTLCYSEFQGKN